MQASIEMIGDLLASWVGVTFLILMDISNTAISASNAGKVGT